MFQLSGNLKRLNDDGFKHRKSNSQIFQKWQALESIFVMKLKAFG